MLLATRGWRPGMPLNTPRCPGGPAGRRPAQDASGAWCRALKGNGPSEGAVGRVVREGLSEEGTLSRRDQPWEVPPLHTGHPRAPAACGEEDQGLALRWGRGEAGGDLVPGLGFQKAEGGLLPPPPGSLLPVTSATFLPLGGQGMGARCTPVEIQEALKAACASLLQGPDSLLAGSAPLGFPGLGPR